MICIKVNINLVNFTIGQHISMSKGDKFASCTVKGEQDMDM
jgi:hypothetical protein